ncbi:MAG: oxidoreductase [Ilumatobacteraceae bacterium]|nr:oxidoreductase [Ilumatobacteraceae bacterium]
MTGNRATKRVVVVGASTGLGRCLAIGLAARGAHVALMGRRQEKIDVAAAEAGHGAFAIACDATDEAQCAEAIAAAAERLDGLDTVIYAAATGPLVRLQDADAATWRQTFDTNVIGASLITAAAIPHITASLGNMLFLSTTGASYTPPWPGLGVYQVTKAALDRLVEAWRAEHPGVNFTRVTIGECGGGQGDAQSHFNTEWDRSLVGDFAGAWFARGLMGPALIDVEHLIDMFDALVQSGPSMQVPSITIIPRQAVPAS